MSGEVRVRCERTGVEYGPDFELVLVTDCQGEAHEIPAHRRLLDGDGFEVGIVVQHAKVSLVEFAQESTRGRWRAWVQNSKLRMPSHAR